MELPGTGLPAGLSYSPRGRAAGRAGFCMRCVKHLPCRKPHFRRFQRTIFQYPRSLPCYTYLCKGRDEQMSEERYVCYDEELDIEAYNLRGVVQKFPAHFHEYFVVGYIENGTRTLFADGAQRELSAGDIILFNPRESHCCAPVNGSPLDYRAVNIPAPVMCRAAKEITGCDDFRFSQTVVSERPTLAAAISCLYRAIVDKAPQLEREEAFFVLTEQLAEEFAASARPEETESSDRVAELRRYIEEHFAENITMKQLLSMTNFSRSYLFTVFTKETGLTPYRYLQTVRLERAKKMLAEGMAPAEAAAEAGFADQSHFTNFFKEFIGLTPRQYQRIFNRETTD